MAICYPVNGEVACAERVARWRPLFGWVLAIPLFLWAAVLSYGAAVVSFVGWFSIVFTGRLSVRLGDYLVAVLRYQWRTVAYLYGFTDQFPGFIAPAGYVDPGDYPAVLYSARPVRRRRVTVVFRLILLIPELVVLGLLTLVASVVLVLGWFAVLMLGRWPRGLQLFVIGWMRWSFRVTAYQWLIVDEYPPFGLRP